MLGTAQQQELLDACHRFINIKATTLKELQDLVDRIITDQNSLEWQAWTSHMGQLSDVYQRRVREGENVPWPIPPGAPDQPAVVPQLDASANGGTPQLTGYELREAMCMERKLVHDGTSEGIGPVRMAKTMEEKRLGERKRDELVDRLVLEFEMTNKNNKLTKVTYCIGCDNYMAGHDAAQIKSHAKGCNKLATKFPKYHAEVVLNLAEKSNSAALETGESKHFPAVRKPTNVAGAATTTPSNVKPDVPTGAKHHGMLLEHFNPTKIMPKQQAELDLLLFKVFICCAIPWALLDNSFFRDFIAALAMNYVIPDRSAFFVKHVAQETANVTIKLRKFLEGKRHLTISFDGWSSRGKDEIYTFHITTPSRQSIFAAGHVFNGLSVTGTALMERVSALINEYRMGNYSAVSGDGGPNVRSAKIQIHTAYPWILDIYDPCHNLNLYMKDLSKLFSDVLVHVSGISNYFSKSNYGTFQLDAERKKMNISEGMKSASETRFSSTYMQALAVQRCMPAIKSCLWAGTLAFTTKLTKKLLPYIEEGSEHYMFMASLSALVQLLSSGANAILTLKGQNTTCADIFYVWVCIAYHLEKLLAAPSSGLITLQPKIIAVYNHHFDQMMTESSHHLFLLSYFLHPLFHRHGGLQLVMPLLKNGQKLEKSQYLALFVTLLKSALSILRDEQFRTSDGGKEESDALIVQMIRYCYNQEPFGSRIWDATMKPLDFWTTLTNDSNAQQLARIAVKLFSISPSEICDERTALWLGWFNAVRRSSIRPEHLIDSAHLYDYWVNGFGEGEYTHKAHVHLSAVDESSSEATPLHYSAPSLMDLLNKENVTPKDVDISILEETLFNHPDPYDLAECDRVDPALSAPATVVHSQDCFDIAQYVKLDSPSLAMLITHMSDGRPMSVADAAPVALGSKGKPVDWMMDDYF